MSTSMVDDFNFIPVGASSPAASPPCSVSRRLTRLNGRDPKKPRLADSGDGCTDSTHGTGASSGLSDWASRPHRIAAHGPAAGGERPDRALGDLLPAAAAVRRGLAGPHRQHPVEQHHALVGPRGQVAVRGRLDADVGAQLG